MNQYVFDIPIIPVPKARARIGKFGNVYTPTKTRAFEKFVRDFIAVHYKKEPITSPVSINVVFSLQRPKTCDREKPSVKPDLSNLLKAVEDAANGILWKDDSQIVFVQAEKVYGSPGILLVVNTLRD